MTRFLLSGLLLALSFLAAAEDLSSYIFNRLSYNEGISCYINSIYKESDRDLWAGSASGVYRFDGSVLKHYNAGSVRKAEIYRVTSDSDGNILAFGAQGICKYDYASDGFVPFSDEKAFQVPMISFCKDDGGIWIGSLGKVFRLDYASGSLSLHSSFEDSPSFGIKSISVDGSGRLLCTGFDGIRLVDMASGDVDAPSWDCPKEISVSVIDSKGRIWIAAYNGGLMCLDSDGRQLSHITSQNSDLPNNVILSIIEHDGRLWLGTDGGGIGILDPDTGEIGVITHISGNPSSFPTNSVKCLHSDHYGNVWAGSIRDGIICISSSHLHTFGDTYEGGLFGLSNSTVLSLFQEKGSADIWVGTDGGGINRFSPRTGRFVHYRHTADMKVASIADYSADKLVLSLFSRGIYLFDKRTGRLDALRVTDKELERQMLYIGRTVNLCNDGDGSVLFLGQDIYRYDKSSGSFSIISASGSQPSSGSFLPVSANPDYSVFHDLYSLYSLKTGSSELERIYSVSKGTRINSAISDGNGNYYIATKKGLVKYSESDRKETFYETTLFGAVRSLASDGKGCIWLGTDTGLFAWREKENTFVLFGKSDGVQIWEFLEKPHLTSSEGDIFLGGVNGLLKVDSDFDFGRNEVPKLRLSELTVDGDHYAVKDGVADIGSSIRRIGVRVASEEKDIFRKKVYRYSLDDGSRYMFESKSPRFTLSPLPSPGRHDVYVSCSDKNGEWTEPVRILTLDVERAWFKSWWFITLMAAMILTVIILPLYMEMLRKNSEMKIAMKEKEKNINEDKVRFLINISHELKTPLTLIIAPLKSILKQTPDSDRNYSSLNRIYRQSLRMKELLNLILDIRRLESGENSLKIEPNEVNPWITSVVSDFEDIGKSASVTLDTVLDHRLSTVNFDKKKCEIILTNLLMNAIKHSKSGDEIIVTSALTEDGSVRIGISDEGGGLNGIDPEKLFKRFYQGTKETIGTGIGLSYAKVLVEMHGGNISAADNDRGGATFSFELPADLPCGECAIEKRQYLNDIIGASAASEPLKLKADPVRTEHEAKILAVDDNIELLEFIRESFAGSFKEVRLASGGNEALRLMKDFTPDLIISDVSMPDGNGYELCEAVKDNPKTSHIPVILCTAIDDEQTRKEGYQIGADAFLGKPFETETLYALICNKLKEKQEIRKRYLDEKAEDKDFGAEDESFIIALNKVIGENISEPSLDNAFLCRELGVSRTMMYNRLKAISDMGPKEYISKIRIEKAISLMEHTDKSIADIASMTGFSTPSYFSTAFKQFTGKTPSQYRRELKESSGKND